MNGAKCAIGSSERHTCCKELRFCGRCHVLTHALVQEIRSSKPNGCFLYSGQLIRRLLRLVGFRYRKNGWNCRSVRPMISVIPAWRLTRLSRQVVPDGNGCAQCSVRFHYRSLTNLQLPGRIEEYRSNKVVRKGRFLHSTRRRRIREDFDSRIIQAQQLRFFRATTQHVRVSQEGWAFRQFDEGQRAQEQKS